MHMSHVLVYQLVILMSKKETYLGTDFPTRFAEIGDFLSDLISSRHDGLSSELLGILKTQIGHRLQRHFQLRDPNFFLIFFFLLFIYRHNFNLHGVIG